MPSFSHAELPCGGMTIRERRRCGSAVIVGSRGCRRRRPPPSPTSGTTPSCSGLSKMFVKSRIIRSGVGVSEFPNLPSFGMPSHFRSRISLWMVHYISPKVRLHLLELRLFLKKSTSCRSPKMRYQHISASSCVYLAQHKRYKYH